MFNPQDAASAASTQADAITAKANTVNSSALHFAGYYAHQSASAAWSAIGTTTAKIAAHSTQAQTHLTTANQLKAAGK